MTIFHEEKRSENQGTYRIGSIFLQIAKTGILLILQCPFRYTKCSGELDSLITEQKSTK